VKARLNLTLRLIKRGDSFSLVVVSALPRIAERGHLTKEGYPMRRLGMFLLLILTFCLAGAAGGGTAFLFAQVPAQQQKFEEEVRFAQNIERLSYVLFGVGFLLIVASIPVGIYWDRRKKARRRAEQERAESGRPSSRSGDNP